MGKSLLNKIKTGLKIGAVTALTPLILAFGSREVSATLKSNSEKINSPEYAEEVRTDQSGYKHWRFGNVWYSNKPLKDFLENKLEISNALGDTINYEDIRMDPFSQPNDSNLVWYGSGDIDSNNVRDWNDHNLISQGAQNDQADIDGDGVSGTQEDAELFSKYLNGDTLLPQVSWNWEICSKEDRKTWLDKMLAIDKTDTISYTDEWQCGNFSKQITINFYGFGEATKDSSLMNEIDPGKIYDFSNNGRFNLPIYQVRLVDPNHSINSCLIGENPLDWWEIYKLEPQDDSEAEVGSLSIGENSRVKIYHSYFIYSDFLGKVVFMQEPFIEFKLTDGIPEFIKHDERLILQRPYVNSIKPEKPNLLEKFVLNQNYPNPFNSNTTIKYSLPFDDKVTLNIYNLKGNLVETLVNEKQRAGKYTIPLDASGLSSGIYLYRLNAESARINKTKKFTVIK